MPTTRAFLQKLGNFPPSHVFVSVPSLKDPELSMEGFALPSDEKCGMEMVESCKINSVTLRNHFVATLSPETQTPKTQTLVGVFRVATPVA